MPGMRKGMGAIGVQLNLVAAGANLLAVASLAIKLITPL
jgi:hypothetical protein